MFVNILFSDFFFAVVQIELRALCMLNKHSTTELYPQSSLVILNQHLWVILQYDFLYLYCFYFIYFPLTILFSVARLIP
jgi:hypothetical protein